MKRPHRRLHLLMWPAALLVGAFGLLAAIGSAPADPVADLPGAAVTDEGR